MSCLALVIQRLAIDARLGRFYWPVLDNVARAFRHLPLPDFSHEDALFAMDMLLMVMK